MMTMGHQKEGILRRKGAGSRLPGTADRSRVFSYFLSGATHSSRLLRAAAVGTILLTSVFRCSSANSSNNNNSICRRKEVARFWSVIGAEAAEASEEKEVEESEAPESPAKLTGEKLAELLQLDLKEIKERMSALFELIDLNKDDEIDHSEAKEWSLKLKNAMHDHQVVLEFQAIDKNNDGVVSFEELAATYVSGSDPKQIDEHKEEVRKRFKAVDKDKNDVLDLEEVKLLMDPGKDETLTELEIEEILATQDKDKDRKITLQEFIETEGGTVTESEKQELQKEFDTYDLDSDGSIDAEELRRIIREPHAHEIGTLLEEFMKDLPEGTLPKSRWISEFEKFAVSVLTDNGEALRYPEDYKGIPFPYSASTGAAAASATKEAGEHDEL